MTDGAASPSLRARPRLVDDVVHVLREKIFRGELPAGTQLLQIDLAAALGVSRTPLREAFRILENDGLVRTSNNNRTVEVVTITSADLQDMYQIREVVDGLAARLAGQRRLPPDAATEARRLLDEMAASCKPYDPVRRTEAHAEFHTLFVLHSGNDRLRALIPLIRASSAALYLPFINDPGAVELVNKGKLTTHAELLDESQHSHGEILEAVLAGDGAAAEKAARAHIARTLSCVDLLDDWRRIIAEAAAAQAGAGATPGRRPRTKAG